jgi:AcrR family transcriptional regulator
MNPLPRTKPEDTRERIVDTAETLFRQLGFNKTAVADIAAELRMSPANVYRFFSSKNAIVEAIAERCLGELEDKEWAIARARESAATRFERLVFEILTYHKENHLTEQKVKDIVLFALEQDFDVCKAHKNVHYRVMEIILRDGIDAGEFEPLDPVETARDIIRSLVCFTHPAMIAHAIATGEDVEANARASAKFLLRAITKRQ